MLSTIKHPNQMEKTLRSTQINVKEDVVAVLKTVSLTAERYGMNYLVSLVRGDAQFGLKDPVHATFETFGALGHQASQRVRCLIEFLLEEDYLVIRDAQYGTLGLGESGTVYLDSPEDWWVRPEKLRPKPYDRMLLVELRTMRREQSQQAGCLPYQIFTDYTLSCLVKEKPANLAELLRIPGLTDQKANRYGALIIGAVERMQAQRQADNYDRFLRRVESQGYQQVKRLFAAGHTEAEIAQRRGVKPATIRRTLVELHRAGEIDLRPWIQETVPAETLNKGTTYFAQAEDQRLREAYEKLGLDYDTLRLCRLYIADVSARQEELRATG